MSGNALVINLTRFGDLLQSQAAIDDLHQSGHKTALLCLDNFSSAAGLLRNVDSVWPLSGSRLLRLADSSWPGAVCALHEFVNDIAARFQPGYVINLTPTLPARLLTRLFAIRGAAPLGFGMDECGFGVNHNLWASFVSVAATSRGNSPFNISDMLRTIAAPITGKGAGSPLLAEPDSQAAQWARNFLEGKSAEFGAVSAYVGFQLGASQDARRWPVEHFRQTGQELWDEEGICPVLLGTAAESHLGDEYASGAEHPFVNAIGATSIPRLGGLLRQLKLLFSNDTGTLHLASGLGVPSLSFFMATAQPWDTGPTLSGCCCLEPALECHPCNFRDTCARNHECAGIISPATASSLALGFLRHGSWQAGVSSGMKAECRIWLTATDKQGYCTLEPLNEAAASGPGLWMWWLRNFWGSLLDNVDHPEQAEPDFSGLYSALPFPVGAREISEALAQSARMLQATGESGADMEKQAGLGKIFLRNCERIQTHLDSFPPLSSLAAFWREFRASHGSDIARFSRQTAIIARHAQNLADALVRQ